MFRVSLESFGWVVWRVCLIDVCFMFGCRLDHRVVLLILLGCLLWWLLLFDYFGFDYWLCSLMLCLSGCVCDWLCFVSGWTGRCLFI